jgi:hypothetical protein
LVDLVSVWSLVVTRLLDDHPCSNPHYCWVYHETNKVFTPWGTNTELGLRFEHVPTDADGRPGSGSS